MKRLVFAGAMLAFLGGCVSVPPERPVTAEFWKNDKKSVVIVMKEIPPPEYTTTGQQGLLDLAVNESVNSELDDYLETLDTSEFQVLGSTLKATLEGEGITVTAVHLDYELGDIPAFNGPTGADFPSEDYRSLQDRFDADYLLLVDVLHAGITRPFYGFVPTGEPMTSFNARGQLINLETNRLHWLQRTDSKMAIQSPWDEPPKFPNITSAFYKTLAKAQAELRNDFRVIETNKKSSTASP